MRRYSIGIKIATIAMAGILLATGFDKIHMNAFAESAELEEAESCTFVIPSEFEPSEVEVASETETDEIVPALLIDRTLFLSAEVEGCSAAEYEVRTVVLLALCRPFQV